MKRTRNAVSRSPRRPRRTNTHKVENQGTILRKVFEGTHDGIFVTNPNRDRLLEVNPRACQMLGYSREELLSLPMSVIHPGEAERLQAFGLSVMEKGEAWTDELTCLTKDGERLPVEISASVVDFGGRPCMLSLVRDITERVAREGWQRVQSAALDAAGNAVVVTDREGVIQWVNPAFIRNTGYTLEEVVGGTPRILNSGEQSRAFYEDLWAAITSGRTWTGELVNRRKDGSRYRDVQSVTPVTDDTGEITHFVAIKQDVTHERQLEEVARHELEVNRHQLAIFHDLASRLALKGDTGELLRRIAEDTSKLLRAWYGGLFEWDESGRLIRSVMSNPLPADLMGMDTHQRYRSVFEAVRGSGRTLRKDELAGLGCDYLAPQEIDIQNLMAAPIQWDGEVRGILLAAEKEGASDFSDDDQRGLEMLTDVAGIALENRRLHDGVEWREHMLNAVQAGMTDGLIVCDPTGHVISFNGQAEAITGLRTEDVLGQRAEDLLAAHASAFASEEDLEAVLRVLRATTGSLVSEDFTRIWPRRRRLSLTRFPAPGSGGETLTGYLIRDVTGERDLEDRRNNFVSIASHELRTPLTALLGFTELLLVRDPAPEVRTQWLETVNKETQRLTSLVDDMVNVSRIQSSQLGLEIEPTGLSAVAEVALSLVQPIADDRDIRFDIPGGLPPVLADRDKLCQVLMNLLTNAVKYSPGRKPIEVRAQADPKCGRVVVSVSDHGIGIAPEDRERLFGTFERVHRPETEGIQGTELGLYIVRETLQRMGGEIWVESEIGQGSTFSFRLPVNGI